MRHRLQWKLSIGTAPPHVYSISSGIAVTDDEFWLHAAVGDYSGLYTGFYIGGGGGRERNDGRHDLGCNCISSPQGQGGCGKGVSFLPCKARKKF